MTSSNGNIFHVTGPLCGEFTAQRPVERSFCVFFDVRLYKRLGKQSWGWWSETLSHPLWPHYNVLGIPCRLPCGIMSKTLLSNHHPNVGWAILVVNFGCKLLLHRWSLLFMHCVLFPDRRGIANASPEASFVCSPSVKRKGMARWMWCNICWWVPPGI